MESTLKELQKLYPYAAGLRSNNGSMEFALERCDGSLGWFSIYVLPEKAMNYMVALMKLENKKSG